MTAAAPWLRLVGIELVWSGQPRGRFFIFGSSPPFCRTSEVAVILFNFSTATVNGLAFLEHRVQTVNPVLYLPGVVALIRWLRCRGTAAYTTTDWNSE